MNPEYDHVLFTDEDCERFMREVADPEVRRAYEVRAAACRYPLGYVSRRMDPEPPNDYTAQLEANIPRFGGFRPLTLSFTPLLSWPMPAPLLCHVIAAGSSVPGHDVCADTRSVDTQVLIPKAGKADIWRLAIIYQYGGIYVDSDVKALYAFREYVWPNASVVSGLGSRKDFHQWCGSSNNGRTWREQLCI